MIGSSTLYPTQQVADRVTAYSSERSAALPKYITDYHEWVLNNHERFNYMISNFQGQCHLFLARLIGAERILEVGVYIGYSSLVWSHAVGPQGHVTGLEFSPEYAQMARDVFEKNDIKNIEVIEGDALKTLPALKPEQPYDLIFIDAQKSGYPEYLRHILENSKPGSSSRILRKGGVIIADNVLRRGIVADDSEDNPWVQKMPRKSEYETDHDLEGLRTFNDAMNSNERLEAFLMPLFDGFGLARLLD